MQIWKSQNFPPSTSYVWARLNSNYQIVGYFKYEGGKWVLKKKEELEESAGSSGGGSSNQSIIDTIVDGAPEEYDTLSEIATALNNLSEVAFSGDYDDLSGTPTIPTVPTNISELNNDAGYLTTTNQQIPSGWETNGTMADLIKDINEDETAIAGKSYFGTVSVRDLPANLIQAEMKIEVMVYDESVPLDPDHNMYQKVISFTVTSSNVSPYHWEYTSSWGNTGSWRSFLTEHQSLSNYALKSEIPEVPTNISAFNNDSGYLTSHQDISGKADKVSSPTNGNFAGLDSNGNLTDSGKKASDFATAAQGGKADTAIQPSLTAGLLKNDGTVDTTAYTTNTGTVTGVKVGSTSYSPTSGVVELPSYPSVPVTDVTVGGTSVVSNGTAAIPSIPNVPVTDVTVGGITVVSNGTAVIPAIPTVPTISTNIQTNKTSDTMTVSPKAVYDEVHPATDSSQPVGGILPNKLYKLGILTGNVTITFASPTDNTIENEYKFTFTSGIGLNLTWPQDSSSWKWAGNAIDNNLPNIEDGEYYEVSVLDGVGIINKFE